MSTSRAPRRSREFWADLAAEFEQSGHTVRAFARRHQIKEATLRAWLNRLGRTARPAVRMLPVKVVDAEVPRESVSVEAQLDGVVLRFSESVSPAYVGALIREVRRC